MELRHKESFLEDFWLPCALEGSAGNMNQLLKTKTNLQFFQQKSKKGVGRKSFSSEGFDCAPSD